jgi:cytochrome c oxidase subunit IV
MDPHHDPDHQRTHGQVVPGHGDPGYAQHEHGGTGKYWVVFGLLCALTTLSFLTYFDWWHAMFSIEVSRALMMAVSCAKAMLVIAFFMHLIWEANWKYVLTIPAAFMSVFLICMLVPDIGFRTQKYSDARWQHAAIPHVHGPHHPEPGEEAQFEGLYQDQQPPQP